MSGCESKSIAFTAASYYLRAYAHRLFFQFIDIRQIFKSRLQGLIFFGKMEPDIAVFRFMEETGSRNGADFYFFRKVFAEFQIVIIAKFGNIHHDVICALRNVVFQADLIQSVQEKIALVCINSEQFIIVTLSELQTRNNGLLERRRRADGQEIVHLANAVGDFRRRNRITETPAGDRVRL